MRSNELQALVKRLLQYLILDYAIDKIRFEEDSQTMLSAEFVNNWFRRKGCSFEQSPPISGLPDFLSSYLKLYGGNRGTSRVTLEQKCTFTGGCVFENPELTKKHGIAIECDHIIPISRSGRNQQWNFQPLCRKHNRLKGNALFWSDSKILPIKGWDI
jgi:hypothetical protein